MNCRKMNPKARLKPTKQVLNTGQPRGPKGNIEKRIDQLLTSAELDDKPTSIYRYNSRVFLESLRCKSNPVQTNLSCLMSMSKELVDEFVRMKMDQVDQLNDDTVQETRFKKKTPTGLKKKLIRPKSASATTTRRNVRLVSNQMSKSNSKLEKIANEEINSDEDEELGGNKLDNPLEPIFHKSLDKISSIANWERQIRYELEIEKELQRRELERQREKLQKDQRKLDEWDKQLRIELDARERKLRLGEDQFKSKCEEVEQKSTELIRKEQMINEIVNERIKAEMKFEIEKLRKKFLELEIDKSNLTKKEERVKEVEARLHEQVRDNFKCVRQ